MGKAKSSPLLGHLKELERLSSEQEINLRDIFTVFGPEGHHLLILFMMLPLMQPIPLFVLSTPFGILTAIACYCNFRKIDPWLPKSWESKILPQRVILPLTQFAEKLLLKLESFFHQRWSFYFRGPFVYINLSLSILMAILLALPLPIPLSNALPAWMIFFQSLAHLERDGLFILLSYIQSILCILYFVLIFLGVQMSWGWLGQQSP